MWAITTLLLSFKVKVKTERTFFRSALVLATLFCLLSVPATAQNKRSGKTAKTTKNQQSTLPAGPDQVRLAEMYHAEAEKYYLLENYPKALALYQKSLEQDPSNGAAHYQMGGIYAAGEQYDRALYHAHNAIGISKNNKFYYLLAAEIYTKMSSFAEAALVYEQMLANCRNVDEYLFELAALHIYQEKYDQALNVYDRIESKFGVSDQVSVQKQKLYLKQGNLAKAVQEGEKLIANFPGDERFPLLVAEILISNDRPDQAIPYLENLLDRDPKNPMALLQLSEIYRKKGDAVKANEYLGMAFENPDLNLNQKLQVMVGFLQKLPNDDIETLAVSLGRGIIVSHPDDPDAYAINGDLMMKLEKRDEALEYYMKAIDLGASNYSIWQNVIQIEMQLERYDQAIALGERAIELYPNQAALYWFLGTSFLISKREEEAVPVLEQGKKVASGNEDLLALFNAQLGDAYNNTKNYRKSDESYEAALARDPENDHVLNNYSYFLSLRREKLEYARKMSAGLVERNPDNSTYLDTHAWVLYALGEYDEALIYIERAMKGDDLSGTIIEHYGDILYKLGHTERAMEQWLRAREMSETSDLLDRKIADRTLYE